ncbi:MAG: acyltransferase [Blautia sp.]
MKIFRKIYNHILSSKKSISKEDQWRERGVRIGKNFDAPDSVIDYCFGFLVTIGDNVTLSGTTVLAHDGSTKKILGYSKVGNVVIGNNVFVGYGSIILPNVRIGNNVIVGAGTIVSKDIPDNVVVVQGKESTYRILCSYDEYVEKNKQKINNLPVSNILFEQRSSEQQEDWRNL